jgi:hypothetical protein
MAPDDDPGGPVGLQPRIALSLALSRLWSHSTWLLAYRWVW